MAQADPTTVTPMEYTKTARTGHIVSNEPLRSVSQIEGRKCRRGQVGLYVRILVSVRQAKEQPNLVVGLNRHTYVVYTWPVR